MSHWLDRLGRFANIEPRIVEVTDPGDSDAPSTKLFEALAAATTDVVGEAFNVGTGTSVTIRELADHVRSLVDASVDLVHTEPRPGDIDASRADVEKIYDTLGFESRVSLAEGLRTLPGVGES